MEKDNSEKNREGRGEIKRGKKGKVTEVKGKKTFLSSLIPSMYPITFPNHLYHLLRQ